MKITFIYPNAVAARASAAIQPLSISILSGLTPPDVDVEFFDERIEEIPLDRKTDLVAISILTLMSHRSYQIADAYRNRGVPVIVGGYHPTFCPEEALRHADSVAIGEAEGIWGTIVDDARKGKLKKIYQHEHRLPLVGLKYNRKLFESKKYNPIIPVEFNRGCKYACDFCSVSSFYKRSFRSRPVDDVIKEIVDMKARHIMFIDDNIFADEEKAGELFEALIPLKIIWGCQISIDIVKNDRLLKLMAKSGCVVAMIGFESLSRDNLMQMKKKANLSRVEYTEAVAKIKDHGIMIYGSFIFGYGYDKPETIEKATLFALKNNFFLTNFNTLTPVPGTALYDRFKSEGRFFDDEWWLNEKYKYGEVSFKPEGMSANDLKNECINARLEFYSRTSILKRLLDFKANCRNLTNLWVYLLVNIVTRKDIIRLINRIKYD